MIEILKFLVWAEMKVLGICTNSSVAIFSDEFEIVVALVW